jgi:hypothetical protein
MAVFFYLIVQKKKKKKKNKAVRSRHQWLTPRILATWEAAIRRIAVQSQSQANSS